MKNKYEVMGDTAYIFIRRRNGQAYTVMVDAEDIERIEVFGHKIYADYKKNIKAPYAVLGNAGFLHRFLMDAPNGMVVDHINHNTLDNRKSNLRVCTYSENAQNKKGATNKSKSGILGVCFDNTNKKWLSVIRKNNETVFRKAFKNQQDAVRAIVEARKIYCQIGQAQKEATP